MSPSSRAAAEEVVVVAATSRPRTENGSGNKVRASNEVRRRKSSNARSKPRTKSSNNHDNRAAVGKPTPVAARA